MRHRGLILFLILFATCFFNGVSYSQSSTLTNGLTYLTATQSPDGSWGNEATGTEILPSTIVAIEALKALNQSNTLNYINALVWLQSQGLQTTDYFSERIHALMVSGADKDVLLSYLDDLIGAWGGYNDCANDQIMIPRNCGNRVTLSVEENGRRVIDGAGKAQTKQRHKAKA